MTTSKRKPWEPNPRGVLNHVIMGGLIAAAVGAVVASRIAERLQDVRDARRLADRATERMHFHRAVTRSDAWPTGNA